MEKWKVLFVLIAILVFKPEAQAQEIHHWETIINASDTWKYTIPSAEPDTNWRHTVFTDDSWSSGSGGFGYGDNDDGTIVPNGTQSVFFRKKFTIQDTSQLLQLKLHADFDDAFVAYLNGFEIARGGGLSDKHPTFNQKAAYTHEAVMYSNVAPDGFLISLKKIRKLLINGENVLSVQVHNDTIISSDLSCNIFLLAGIKNESVLFSPTPSWFIAPLQNAGSSFPLVMINTFGQYIPDDIKINAHMTIIFNNDGTLNYIDDTTKNYDGNIGIEIRGSSSQMFPKKSYSFETRTALDSNLNVPLIGLPADNDWVLYAPYSDKTFLRDILAYKLGNEMGHYTPRTKFCELYLNEDYQGVYVLIEKIKQGKNRVDISDLKTTEISGKDITGGYIFKIDKEVGTNNESWTSNYKSKQAPSKEIHFFYHYPKPDEITEVQKNYLSTYVTQFENTLKSDFFANTQIGYQKFIDIPSFVDYFLINEISKNIDGYRISSFFHKNREDKGGKIVAGPLWDYNLSFGNVNYYDGDKTSGWYFNSAFNELDDYQIPFWWERFLQDPYYCSVLNDRYILFRKTILKTERINSYIDSMVQVLQKPQERNYSKWNILGQYIWPNPVFPATYAEEIANLKTWISDRLWWIDNNLPKILILTGQENLRRIVNNAAVVYPNPFTDNFYVELFPDRVAKSASIALYDLTGKLLFLGESEVSSTEKILYSISEQSNICSIIPTGMYLLKIKLDTGKEFQSKIVKK
jgi:hypothetical protein